MRIALIQHDILDSDAKASRERLREPIAAAVAGGARLVVLSEMYATGFSMDLDAVAEEPGGDNERFLFEQAAEHGVWVVGSVSQWSDLHPERAERRGMNVAILAGPDGTAHRYRKIHPFSYGQEDRYYDAGSEFVTVDVEGLRVSLFICYDLRFGDEFWARAHDTDLYVVPANWPASRGDHWTALLRARAIENLAYVAGCNRVGTFGAGQTPLLYDGASAVLDPRGRTLVEARLGETVLFADVDPAEVQATRDRFGFLADRR